jgi:hypothetical protein
MRTQFPGYYKPSLEELISKFKECIFSFDTSSILNLYRFTPKSGDELLKVLGTIKDRLWLPYQVGYEYHDNRIGVIVGQQEMYEELKKAVNEAIKLLEQKRRSESFHVTSLIEPIRKALEEIRTELEKKKADHPNSLEKDPILDALTELFEGKIGDSYDSDEHKKKLALAKQRFETKQPPGFLDGVGRKKKEGDRKYGDVVLWFQLLDFAKKTDKPIILVTGETGEDWWQKAHGKTIGPRPELIQEMHEVANGRWFYLYSTEQFLKHAKDYLAVDFTADVIREAEAIEEQDAEQENLRLAEKYNRKALDLFNQTLSGSTEPYLPPGISGLTSSLVEQVDRLPKLELPVPKVPIPDFSSILQPILDQQSKLQRNLSALAEIIRHQTSNPFQKISDSLIRMQEMERRTLKGGNPPNKEEETKQEKQKGEEHD